MNILLTNDDGIESEGILCLAQALRSRKKARVCILAPESNRSGSSHGIRIFTEPIKLTEKSEDVWTCSGLPVDCVIAAVLGGKPCKPDIIISGINHGPNMGSDITYSGTAAAARQGAMMGLPSVALSLNGWSGYNWSMVADYSAVHLDDFLKIWEKDIFVNVNIPNRPEGPKGIVFTRPCRKDYHDALSMMQGPFGSKWCFLIPGEQTVASEPGSDWEAVSRNFVSVSPVFIHPVVLKDLNSDAPDHTTTGRGEVYGC